MTAFRAALGDAPAETMRLPWTAPVRESGVGPGGTRRLDRATEPPRKTTEPARKTTLSSTVGTVTAPPTGSRRRLLVVLAGVTIAAAGTFAALRLGAPHPEPLPALTPAIPPPPLPAPAPEPEPEPIPAAAPDAAAAAPPIVTPSPPPPERPPARRSHPRTRQPPSTERGPGQPEKW
jgi:hypothetical protein